MMIKLEISLIALILMNLSLFPIDLMVFHFEIGIFYSAKIIIIHLVLYNFKNQD